MRAVNLLPPELKEPRRFRGETSPSRVLLLGGLLAAVVAAAFVAAYARDRSTVRSRRSDLAEVQGRIVAVQARVATIQALEAQASARVSIVSSVTGSRMDWDRALGDLARVLPSDVFLTGLTASAPGVSAGAPSTSNTASTSTSSSGSTLQITGIAPSHVVVALVLDRLTLLPWLSNVSLLSTTRETDGTVQFNVDAGVSQEH